jgi:hypothetical protein
MINTTMVAASAAAKILDRLDPNIDCGNAVHRQAWTNRAVAGKPTAVCPRSMLLATKSS